MTILRPATPADAPALAELARESFIAAFGDLYTPEDLAGFLASDRSAERYLAHLADPHTQVMLAEVDGQLAAYALIVIGKQFDEHPDPRPQHPVFLSQLYCSGAMTGRGLGAALIDWVIGEARANACDAVTLSVFSGNPGAQRFYQRYGFRQVADIHFWVGQQRDDEYLYELRL